MFRRVVITGLGIVSPIGQSTDEVTLSLENCSSGMKELEDFRDDGKPCRVGAEVKNFNARDHIDLKQRKQLKVMSRDVQFSVVAAKYAMESAGMSEGGNYDPDRFGLSIGSSLINNDLDELGVAYLAASENGKIVPSRVGSDVSRALFPLWMLKYLPNMPACHISMAYDLRGSSNSITTEAASGLQAIGEAFRIIQRGSADCMIAGSVDSKINGIAVSKYDLLKYLPPDSKLMEMSYTPFSDNNDFIIPGEGAGLLVLEERERAEARGATILAEIKGFGTAPIFDYKVCEARDVEGRRLAISKALREAKFTSADLDFIVAHGMGIKAADDCELESLKQIVNGNKTPITCLKPLIGYSGAASGALDTIAAILAIKNRTIWPIKGEPKKTSEVNLITKAHPLKDEGPFSVLINSYGITGQAAAITLESD